MEKSAVGRYVALAYIGAAILLGFVLSRIIHAGLFYGGIEDFAVMGSKDFPMSSLAAGAVAVIVGIICFKNAEVRTLADEVAMELSKVTWPSRQETWAATIVVIATVAIAALYLGIFDAVWLWASNQLLSIPSGGSNG